MRRTNQPGHAKEIRSELQFRTWFYPFGSSRPYLKYEEIRLIKTSHSQRKSVVTWENQDLSTIALEWPHSYEHFQFHMHQAVFFRPFQFHIVSILVSQGLQSKCLSFLRINY